MGRLAVRLAALAMLMVVTAGCLVEAPYTSGRQLTPFAVTLTADSPVTSRDVTATSNVRMGSASAMLVLHAVDPRVRVALTGAADADANNIVDGLGTFHHPDSKGDLGLPLRSTTPCRTSVCEGAQRLIFELTEPRLGEAVTVSGAVEVQYGYNGTSPLPGPAMVLSGFDAGSPGHRADEIRSSTAGTTTTLDADHPVAFQPIQMALHLGDRADPLDIATESSLRPGGSAVDGVSLSVDPVNPRIDFPGLVRPLFGAYPFGFDPFLGCGVVAGGTCMTKAMIRMAWTGTLPRVQVTYDIDTILASYAAGGLPEGTSVSATLDRMVSVPVGAPIVASSTQGGMVLDRGSPDHRATTWFRFGLGGAPTSPSASIVEVPGVVLVTYSAVGKDGPSPADGPAARLSLRASARSTAERVDVPLDGVTRTAAIGLLATCRPGQSCTQDFFFELFGPAEGDDTFPITLTYRLDARVTSFDDAPFGPATTISIGPRPNPP